MAQSNAHSHIPAIYRFTFLWMEPILNLSGIWICLFDKTRALDTWVPATLVPHNPLLDILMYQLAGCFIILMITQGWMLRYTADVGVRRIFNFGGSIWDIILLYAWYDTFRYQGRLSLSALRPVELFALVNTIFVTGNRIACALGIGFGQPAMNSRGVKSN